MALNYTAGDPTANSYVSAADAEAYFAERLPLSTPWDDVDNQEAALIMATRLLDALFRGSKVLIPATSGAAPAYKTNPKWKGAPSSTTQRLAWPRTGLQTQNGGDLDPAAIPQEIKDAVCEFAGQLAIKDTTLDNAALSAGINSVKAGSTAVTFTDYQVLPKQLPDAVLLLIPSDWYTEEKLTGVAPFDFEAIS